LTPASSEAPALEEPPPATDLFSFEKATAAQESFSKLVKKRSTLPKRIVYVAGVDVAYAKQLSFAVAAALNYRNLKPIEVQHVSSLVKVPYRAGFLGFREAAPMVEAVRELNMVPDVVLVDGHGLAHPRGFGLACHVGVVLDLPTIGVAKSLFYGKLHRNRVLDREGRSIGAAINVKEKIFYVSVGHKISLNRAVEVASNCIIRNMLEPIRIAHQEATRMARKIES